MHIMEGALAIHILSIAILATIPLTQTIYKYYQIFSKNYFLFSGVPRDCPLIVYDQKNAKINFIMAIMPYCINTFYTYNQINTLII